MKFIFVYIDSVKFLIRNFSAFFINCVIQNSFYFQTVICFRTAYQRNYCYIINKRFSAPVLRNKTEHSVFDFIPFARSGRKMTHMNFQRQFLRQFLQFCFPKPCPVSVASSAVRCNIYFFCIGI